MSHGKKILHKAFLHKILLPFSITLIFIAIISILNVYYVKHQYKLHKIKIEKNLVKNAWDNKISNNKTAFSSIIDFIEKDKEIIKFFKAKDRDKLYNHSKIIFDSLTKKYNLTHFYFYEKNRNVFLRVHNYKKHSDIINRYTLKQVAETQQEVAGIEFGIFHNLTLRVLKPFIVKGELIGYLELGEEIDYLTPYISNVFKSETIVALTKEQVGESNFKMFEKLHNKVKTYEKTNKYFIINSTIDNIPHNLKQEIDNNTQGVNTDIYLNGSNYSYLTIDLFDVSNKKVGKLIVLTNLKEENEILKQSVYLTITITLIITVVMLIFYYKQVKVTNLKLQKLANEVVILTITDELTGLYNKRYFNEAFIRELNSAIRSTQYISLLIIDIDNFKKFNDIYGHLEGDEALSVVAKQIKSSLKRKKDLCFRVGGEEFAVLLLSCDKNSTVKIADRIVKNIYDLNLIHKDNDNFGRVTISIGGFSTIATKDLAVDEIYTSADKALYKAKNKGRNTYFVYEDKKASS